MDNYKLKLYGSERFIDAVGDEGIHLHAILSFQCNLYHVVSYDETEKKIETIPFVGMTRTMYRCRAMDAATITDAPQAVQATKNNQVSPACYK